MRSKRQRQEHGRRCSKQVNSPHRIAHSPCTEPLQARRCRSKRPWQLRGLLQDITERKRAETALRESEERLRFALEAAGAGTWEAVLETGEFTASERALALHGAPPGSPMSLEKALETVHPEDRPRVKEVVRQLRAKKELGSNSACRFRTGRSGGLNHAASRGSLLESR